MQQNMQDEQEGIIKHKEKEVEWATFEDSKKNSKKVVITFLGFHGHESCFAGVYKALQEKGFICIEASPQSPGDLSGCSHCCGKCDG